jgi:hypothetical protein
MTAQAAQEVGEILVYTGGGCAENSSSRVHFCLDFRNSSGGYDVEFAGSGMRFDWQIEASGSILESGGSQARFQSRTGTPASWGFHRQEINGLNPGVSYRVSVTVDNGGEITVRTLDITTPGSSASAPVPPSSESPSEETIPENPAVGQPTIEIRSASQMNTGDSINLEITIFDLNGNPVPNATVTLFSVGQGRLQNQTATTDLSGVAKATFTAAANDVGQATIYATYGSIQAEKLIEILGESGQARFGGYAAIHPTTGHVCGVIASNGNSSQLSAPYMGCPAGSALVFQTKPSPSGNVSGWHGVDVIFRDGTFYLPSGTQITDGIATDADGRVWDTGSGATLVSGQRPSVDEGSQQEASSSPSSSSTSQSAPSEEDTTSEPVEPVEPVEEFDSPSVTAEVTSTGVSLRVLNGVGKRLSARIAGRWLVETVNESPFVTTRTLVPGQIVELAIWLDGSPISQSTIETGLPQQLLTSSPSVGESISPSVSDSVNQSQSAEVSDSPEAGSEPVQVRGNSIEVARTALSITPDAVEAASISALAEGITGVRTVQRSLLQTMPRDPALSYRVTSTTPSVCLASSWRVRIMNPGLCLLNVEITDSSGNTYEIIKRMRRLF